MEWEVSKQTIIERLHWVRSYSNQKIYCNWRLYYLRLEFFDEKLRIVMFADLVIVKCTTKNVNTYVYVNAYIWFTEITDDAMKWKIKEK